MLDKFVDKIMDLFSKNSKKDDDIAYSNQFDGQDVQRQDSQYNNQGVQGQNNQYNNQGVQGQGNQYNNQGTQWQVNNHRNLPDNVYKKGMKSNSNDPGFTDYPYIYVKSRWFFPTIIVLIVLILGFVCFRLFYIPDGNLKAFEQSAPDILYTDEANEIIAKAKGSGSMRHVNFFFESSDDFFAEPETKAGIEGSKIKTTIIAKRTGTVTLSSYATLLGIKTQTQTKEVTICNRLNSGRVEFESMDMVPGDKYTIKIDLGESSACYDGISYSTSDRQVVALGDNGELIAKGLGSAVVEVKQGNYSAKINVTVGLYKVYQTGITVDKNSLEIEKNTKEQIIATITPDNATSKAMIWTSSDTTIATVSNRGVVSGNRVGEAVITVATVEGEFVDRIPVTVVAKKTIPVRGIKFDQSTYTVEKEGTVKIETIFNPSDASDKTIVWELSNPDIAFISKNGLLTAYETGTLTVTGTTQDGAYKATATIEITDN